MTDSIYVLDFRRGTVEKVDNTRPPKGLTGPAPIVPVEPARKGYTLTSLVSEPEPEED